MMLPEHWPLYHKIIKDYRGYFWLVDIGVPELPLMEYFRSFHERSMPFVQDVMPVSPEYYEKYFDEWNANGKTITMETLGGDVVQQDGGGW